VQINKFAEISSFSKAEVPHGSGNIRQPKVMKIANGSNKIIVNQYRSGEKVPSLALQKLQENSSNQGSVDMGLVSRRPLVAR